MKVFLLFCLCLLTGGAIAQPGIAEMQQARQDLSSSYFSAFDCALVIATLLGLSGAVKIYHNWQMGRKEITADVAGWFYAAFFMVLAGAFLRALFGI